MIRTFQYAVRIVSAVAWISPSHAASLLNVDFEEDNDFDYMIPFSENSEITVFTLSQPSLGNNGTEGHEITVFSQSAPPTSFAGALWGPIDLAKDPNILAGSVTMAQLDRLNIQFDMEVLGLGINMLRMEARLPSGDFDNRVEFPAPTGSWDTYNIDFSTLDLGQKTAMLNSLNTNGVTELNFAFNFNDSGGGIFVAGTGVRLDNFSATTVPEPSSALFCILGLSLSTRRRR